MERVVLRKGAWPRKFTSCYHMPVVFYAAWLPRSFTLNALVHSLPDASATDICAFGEIHIVFGEADPPSADWRAARFFRIFFLLP